MRTFLITYDAAKRHSLASAIMQLADAWARPLETTWYIQSRERADALERRLGEHLTEDGSLVIQQVETQAVLLNTALHWFRKRRQDAAHSNVVALATAMPEARAA